MRPSLVRISLLAFLLFLPTGALSQEPPPIVHAVLFYSPTCPHCHQVITEHLVPMQSRYGQRLVILAFDVTQSYGETLYMGMLRELKIPEADWVVPILVAGDSVMIGGLEIPNRFPAMVEAGLAGDGLDLPNLPDLLRFLRDQDLLETRFPGRRMTKVPAELLAGAPALPRDSAGVDSVVASGVEPVDSASPVPDTVLTGASAAAAGDSALRAAHRPDSAADSAAGNAAPPSGPPAGGRVPPPSESPERAGEGADSGAVASRDASIGAAPPSAEPGASAGEASLGLTEAAQELEGAGMWDRFRRDPLGNSFSVVVLGLMVATLLLTGYPPRAAGRRWPAWLVPVLLLLGAGVASYLSFVEVTHAEAVCGPVGDCNTVNQSEYARVFGVLPVGVLGLVGYGVMLILWILVRVGPEGIRGPSALGLWAAALCGTVFSIYLTFLEPFVIGATCAWCLSSAVIMTLLLWVTAPMAAAVWPRGGAEAPGGAGT